MNVAGDVNHDGDFDFSTFVDIKDTRSGTPDIYWDYATDLIWNMPIKENFTYTYVFSEADVNKTKFSIKRVFSSGPL